MEIAKSFLDQIKFAIRPEIFGGEEEENYEHTNVLFHKQSQVGRTLGKTQSPKGVRTAIDHFYKNSYAHTKQQDTQNAQELIDDDVVG